MVGWSFGRSRGRLLFYWMFRFRPDVRDGGARLAWGICFASMLGCASHTALEPSAPCPPPAAEALDRPAHWEKKRRAGDSEACWVVALAYERGGPSAWGRFPRDSLRAMFFYRLACQRGQIKSCTKL